VLAPKLIGPDPKKSRRLRLTDPAFPATRSGMADEAQHLEAAQGGDERAFARLVEPYRRQLRAHCYRMCGSLHDADDLLQESLLRAWRGLPGFAGRSSVRTWLFKVTTTACLDALDKRAPRILPMDLEPATGRQAEPIWIEPWPDADDDLASRESVALAFLVALQLLPPRQRAVLLLREVLGWQASECAELLGLSVPAVNSALQRARETVDRRAPSLHDAAAAAHDPTTTSLLARYVAAWESSDVDALVALLREDATLAMPPIPEWHLGPLAIGASIGSMVFVPGSSGAYRMVPTRANGLPAFGMYRRDAESGEYRASSIHLVEVQGGGIASIVAFIDPSLFEKFGLPAVNLGP
jgi:RNA polymerase sigma-70 factor, ECF subfamily